VVGNKIIGNRAVAKIGIASKTHQIIIQSAMEKTSHPISGNQN
jgi:hypothetical protein